MLLPQDMRQEHFVIICIIKLFYRERLLIYRLGFHYVTGDTEGFVNLPLSIENVAFSVFIREDKDYVKISLRSVGDFPCNQFASRYFNGGGHKNASGGEFYGSLADAVAVFEKGLEEFNPNKTEDLDKHD